MDLVRYRVKEKEADRYGPRYDSPWEAAKTALAIVTDPDRRRIRAVRIRKNDGPWKKLGRLGLKAKIVRRLRSGEINDVFEVKARYWPLRAQIRLVDAYGLAALPPGSDFWADRVKRIYRWVFAEGRFEGVENWGVFNCRRMRNSSSWSYHAWAQAIDIHPTNQVQGDAIKAGLIEKFGAEFFRQIVWWTSLHYDHLHVEVPPTRTGQTPPCAG